MKTQFIKLLSLAIVLTLTGTAYAASETCASPDKTFGSFLQRFRSDAKFRMNRISFPLVMEERFPGELSTEKRVTLRDFQKNEHIKNAVVPPTASAVESKEQEGSFDYRIKLDADSAELTIDRQHSIHFYQNYDFRKKSGCWYLVKIFSSAHS